MNWAFDEWSGPDSGEVDEDSEVVTLTMDADKEFQVNFVDES